MRVGALELALLPSRLEHLIKLASWKLCLDFTALVANFMPKYVTFQQIEYQFREVAGRAVADARLCPSLGAAVRIANAAAPAVGAGHVVVEERVLPFGRDLG